MVLANDAYVELITSDAFSHETYYMGMVDANNHVNFYDGKIRVVDPAGKELAKFDGRRVPRRTRRARRAVTAT